MTYITDVITNKELNKMNKALIKALIRKKQVKLLRKNDRLNRLASHRCTYMGCKECVKPVTYYPQFCEKHQEDARKRTKKTRSKK